MVGISEMKEMLNEKKKFDLNIRIYTHLRYYRLYIKILVSVDTSKGSNSFIDRDIVF